MLDEPESPDLIFPTILITKNLLLLSVKVDEKINKKNRILGKLDG